MNNNTNSSSSSAAAASAARSRKNRSSSARGGRGKVVERQVPTDGVYSNHRFMQSVGVLVGLPVLIQTRTNDTIEGVFTTFSPNFDLVLDMAHPVSRSDPTIINPEAIKRKMIFTASDIVTIKVSNVDLEYATKEGFAVDQVISRYNGQVTERPLEPWQGDSSADDNITLGEESSNGWNVDDMFRKNEEKYGVTTSYTPEMEGYTTPLNRRNTREYREREAKALRIATEILSAPTTQARSEAENGDEEDRYSAVVRPSEQSASGDGVGGSNKYVPPMFRKKNQNSGKTRTTPPPGQGSRYGGSNPTTPTSPSVAGPPRVTSGSHSPIGGSAGPGGASPGYQPQQGPPPSTHSPSPTTHPPPPHRHNSHSHPSDAKLNGEAKSSSYDRRNHDGPMSEMGRESLHNDTCGKPDHHGRQHHGEVQQQKSQPPPPPSHQHTGHMPPMGQGDHRKQAPLEQREPRSKRTNKEEQFAGLRKFSQDFKLSEQSEKKAQTQQQQHQQPPPPQQIQQLQESSQQSLQQHSHQQRQQPPPQQQPPPTPQTQPPPQTQQPPPPQPQQPPPIQPQPPTQSQPPPTHMPPPPPQQAPQRQTPPVSTPIPQGPPQSVSQSPHHPQNPSVAMPLSSVNEVKSHEEVEKLSSAVSNSKLNPNAKEFVLNPHAKPFSPRSPSTTTPPRPHTPQPPQIATNQPPQMAGCPTVGYPQAMVSGAYVMATSQPFPVQKTRFPKMVPIGGNQRPEYTSPMQVAAATGSPILAAPMNSQPQPIPAVQLLKVFCLQHHSLIKDAYDDGEIPTRRHADGNCHGANFWHIQPGCRLPATVSATSDDVHGTNQLTTSPAAPGSYPRPRTSTHTATHTTKSRRGRWTPKYSQSTSNPRSHSSTIYYIFPHGGAAFSAPALATTFSSHSPVSSRAPVLGSDRSGCCRRCGGASWRSGTTNADGSYVFSQHGTTHDAPFGSASALGHGTHSLLHGGVHPHVVDSAAHAIGAYTC
ncbi:Ataxin 2-like [Halocaridina rubra]|uniref:Ataxin 2-like n=1 Tax=Halocaridina rubra TaxID=373956 RepID=A0AAN8ZV64_HALRR